MFLGKIGDFYFKGDIKEIVSTIFPIDSFHQIPINIAENSQHKYIEGTFFRMGSESITPKNQINDENMVKLPVYTNTSFYSGEERSNLEINYRNELQEAPILAITERIEGCSAEECLIQRLTSLIAWNNQQAMILELDWCEGSSEYCINPEWFLRSSKKMKLSEAIEIFSKKVGKLCSFRNCRFYLYVVPLALGSHFQGTKIDYKDKVWQKEWSYDDIQKSLSDLHEVLNLLGK